MTESRGKHISQLDGLRGIAIALVLVAHATHPFTHVPLFNDWLSQYGSLGVQIFFVLSGFLITGILLRSKEHERYLSTFFIRRGLRIYPLYYAVLLFVIASHTVHQHGVHWWPYALYISNLVYGHQTQPAPLGPVWSLAVEEQFYVVWPFIVSRLSLKHLEQLCLLIIASSVVLRLTGSLNGHNTLMQMDALAAGAWIACRPDMQMRLLRIAVPLALLMPLELSASSPKLAATSQTLQVFSSAALLIWTLDNASLPARLFNIGPLRYVGMVSYGLYLLHSFIFALFLRTPVATGVVASGSLLRACACIVLESAVAVALASVSFFLFEKPLLRLKDRFKVGAFTTQRRATIAM